MSIPTISPTMSQIMTMLRSFLLAILPDGTEVIRGQNNRVAEPASADFVVMTFLSSEPLGTVVTNYRDDSDAEIRSDRASTQVSVELEIHGPNGGDNVQRITTLFRTDWAVDQLAASGFEIAPLEITDAQEREFVNGEQQIEIVWKFSAVMQANVVVTMSQSFASALHVGVVEADGGPMGNVVTGPAPEK